MSENRNMTLDDLHEIIDSVGGANVDAEYDVAIVDESTMSVYRINEIYVSDDPEVFTLVINTEERV